MPNINFEELVALEKVNAQNFWENGPFKDEGSKRTLAKTVKVFRLA